MASSAFRDWNTGANYGMRQLMTEVREHQSELKAPESEAQKLRRLAWEAEMIAEADADIAAGRLVDSSKVKAWIDSIGTDNELPVPYAGR